MIGRNRTMKRTVSFFLCLIFMLSLFPYAVQSLAPQEAYAADEHYNPYIAAAWARDDDHIENTDGECAAFVSNALEAGGLSSVWSGGPSTLRSNIIKKYGTEYSMDKVSKIKPGDVVCIHSSSGVLHVMIVVEVGSDYVKISQRNPVRKRKKISFSVLKTYHKSWDAGVKTTFLSMNNTSVNSPSVANSMEYNGHLYERFDYQLSWEEAEAFCQQRGGHLVSITDAAEQDAVLGLLSNPPLGYYHIGATNPTPGDKSNWRWTSDEPWNKDYEPWDKDYPEPGGGDGEYYAAIIAYTYPTNKERGDWIDEVNADTGNSFYNWHNSGFVCERVLDAEAPVISNVTVTDLSPLGYTVNCNVSDNQGVTSVYFPTWTEPNGQDDLANPWPQGTISNGRVSFRVNVSDHNGETGCNYITHIYANDAAGNQDVTGISIFVPSNKHTVSYNANGGSGAPEAQTKVYGYLLPLSSVIPTRDGCGFAGWATRPDASAVEYKPGDYYGADVDVTLYAVWTYYLTYDLNGGNVGPMDQQTNGNTPFVVSDIKAGRKNYRFIGWKEGDVLYQPGDTLPVGNHCLVAQWEPLLGLYAYLDGEQVDNMKDIASYEFLVNGVINESLHDAYAPFPEGTTWELRNIRPRDGYAFTGFSNSLYDGGRTGTLTRPINIRMIFRTIPERPKTEPVKTVFNGHTYYYFTEPMTWYEAKKLCENLGGHLVTINSAEENAYLYDLIDPSRSVWIGATDRDKEGTFSWVTGEPFSYENWETGQPDNWLGETTGDENFAMILSESGGRWNDAQGVDLEYFICEFDDAVSVTYVDGVHSPETQVYAVGTAVSVSTDVPTRAGCIFLGWARSQNAAAAEYQPGDAITENTSLTLYAVWQITRYENSMTLPAALTEIETEAFAGLPVQVVILPAGVITIGVGAFADCNELRLVEFNDKDAIIWQYAFDGCEDFVFYAPAGGSVQTYAERYEIPFIAK